MKETFALPAVGAIIVKKVEDDEFILVQNRKRIVGMERMAFWRFLPEKFASMRIYSRHCEERFGKKLDYILFL